MKPYQVIAGTALRAGPEWGRNPRAYSRRVQRSTSSRYHSSDRIRRTWPYVSTLDAGASFTLFIRGRLFLVRVLRVLRQPETKEVAARISLMSLSPGEAVGPGSVRWLNTQ
jgi:hypothetical protein